MGFFFDMFFHKKKEEKLFSLKGVVNEITHFVGKTIFILRSSNDFAKVALLFRKNSFKASSYILPPANSKHKWGFTSSEKS